MNELYSRVNKALSDRKKDGNYRSLTDYSKYIDFMSNDYLGLSKTESVFSKVENAPGSSRLIAGSNSFNLELEEKLADYFKSDTAILYNSGYTANIGLFSSILKKGDVILYDEEAHASIKDGIRLSFAKAFKFKHNDLNDLKRKLEKYNSNTVFVVIEGLYSMSGDIPKINEINQLCIRFKAHLIVDEAHSAGTFGKDGQGLCAFSKDKSAVLARIITFGKAFGAHGACILTRKEIKQFLINFSRPFIYTTALPNEIVAKIKLNLDKSKITPQQQKLQSNVAYFREKIKGLSVLSHPNSPIQSIIFEDIDTLKMKEKKLLEKEFGVKAIYSPTVKKGSERLRISIHAFNSFKDIDGLCKILTS